MNGKIFIDRGNLLKYMNWNKYFHAIDGSPWINDSTVVDIINSVLEEVARYGLDEAVRRIRQIT